MEIYIDPQVLKEMFSKDLNVLGRREVKVLLEKEETEKFLSFVDALLQIFAGNEYEEELIKQIMKLTAKFGDPTFTEGVKYISQEVRKRMTKDFAEALVRSFRYKIKAKGKLFLPVNQNILLGAGGGKKAEIFADIGFFELMLAFSMYPGHIGETLYEDSKGSWCYRFGRADQGVFLKEICRGL